MKTLVSVLALSTALALPGLASARPVTLTTTLKNYGGDGAYLAVYLTDPSGAYVRTLWVAGKKSKYYKHLPDWHYLISGDPETVHSQGHSVRGWTVSEAELPEDEWENYTIEDLS